MMNRRKRFLCLLLAMTLSFSMVTAAYADTIKGSNDKKGILLDKIEYYQGTPKYPNTEPASENVIARENPPANWQYGGSSSYNKFIRDIAVGSITGVLVGWFGGTAATWKTTAQGILAGAISGSIDATLWCEKSIYYKLNTNGNGYPYYVQEIYEFWLDPDHSTHAYTTVKYFYSYQPY